MDDVKKGALPISKAQMRGANRILREYDEWAKQTAAEEILRLRAKLHERDIKVADETLKETK